MFGFYNFLSVEEQVEQLKVLDERAITFISAQGVRKSRNYMAFQGYLKESRHYGKTIERQKILTLLDACTNLRDRLLLLVLAESGFRIGEALGIKYAEDLDLERRAIRVFFRNDNQNGARAKNAEYRTAYLSPATIKVLLVYCSMYRDLLQKGEFLFITLTGKRAGQPLKVNTVYAFLNRLEGKTGIKVTPHMLRHYFANERKEQGWEILLISRALGHRHIQTTMDYLDSGNKELAFASDAYYQKNKALFDLDRLLQEA